MAQAKLFRQLGSFIKALYKESLLLQGKKYQILKTDFFSQQSYTPETNPTVFLVNLNKWDRLHDEFRSME